MRRLQDQRDRDGGMVREIIEREIDKVTKRSRFVYIRMYMYIRL